MAQIIDFPEDAGLGPLDEKAKERVHHYLGKMQSILAGERPYLGGEDQGDKWLEKQIHILSRKGYTAEEGGAYYRRRVQERVLGYNPIPHKYIDNREKLYAALEEQCGIKHARVAGDRLDLLKWNQRVPIDKQLDSANATIAIEGDFQAMREMLHLLDAKLVQNRRIDYPLIIENPANAHGEAFWDEILRGVKIFEKKKRPGSSYEERMYVHPDDLRKYNIHITESREETLEAAKKYVSQKPPRGTFKQRAFIPDGAVFFVATGTKKKYDEFKKICAANGLAVDVREIFELVDTYVSPPEVSHTYEGNAAEKIDAAFEAWERMSEEERVNRLKHLGITKNQAFFLAEDSGFHFLERNLIDSDKFRKIRHALNPDAPFPGVETGPSTLGSDGIKGFMGKIRDIFLDRQAKGQHVNDKVIKKSVIALAPLLQDNGRKHMTMVVAETEGRVIFEPSPRNGAIEIDNFLIPDHAPGLDKDRTEAQLGDTFYNHHSPRALAIKSLAKEMRIQLNDPSLNPADDYAKDFCAGIVVDEHSYASRHQAEQFEKEAHANGFGVARLSSEFKKAADIQHNVLAKADGIVFAFDPARAKEDFWRNLYLFTSMIVGEQTHDKYKMRKPFYLVNPNGEFDYLIDMVNDFHHSGTVAEAPSGLFRVVKTIEEAVEKLKQDRLSYRRFHLPSYATQEQPQETEGRAGTKDYNVAIFCSATNKNSDYIEAARKLATMLIEEDMGLVSGAGLYSMMGEVTKAAAGASEKGAEHLGSNVPHIMPGEGDARDKMTEFLMARHIYERMEYMIDKSQGFAVMVGGTGTVQETALLVLLKKRAQELQDPYALEKMKGKEIVIINTKMDSGNRRFYDKLKEIIDVNDPEACKKLGIHFVDTVEEAVGRLKNYRSEWRRDHGIPDHFYRQPDIPIHMAV